MKPFSEPCVNLCLRHAISTNSSYTTLLLVSTPSFSTTSTFKLLKLIMLLNFLKLLKLFLKLFSLTCCQSLCPAAFHLSQWRVSSSRCFQAIVSCQEFLDQSKALCDRFDPERSLRMIEARTQVAKTLAIDIQK